MRRCRSLLWVSLACIATAWVPQQGFAFADSEIDSPTHRQVRTIRPEIDGQKAQLHTFCLSPGGEVVAACSLESSGGALVFLDAKGNSLKQVKLEFAPTAVNFAPDGSIFAAGNGKLVHLQSDGTLIKSGESPAANMSEEDKEKAIKQAETQAKQMAAMLEQQLKMLKDQIEKIEKKEESERSRLETARLDAFQGQLEMYESIASEQLTINPEDILSQTLTIPSIAVSDQDLFVTCRSAAGYGYEIWRTNYDFEDAKRVVDSVSGCCGQMDIQCCEGNLVIAENSNFQVAFYDRDGKAISSFGKRDRTSKSGFGSCCNPMNVRPLADGTVLTAESSIGHIKRFDQEGKLLGYVGKAKIGGGCKHCALGFDADSDTYFLMHQDANQICVLANQADLPAQTEEEKVIAKLRAEFDPMLLGKWQLGDKPVEEKKQAGSLLGNLVSSFLGSSAGPTSNLPFDACVLHPDGKMEVSGGMYGSFGGDWAWEPVSGKAKEIKLTVFNDQVETLTMTVGFSTPDNAEVIVDCYGEVQAVPGRRVADCSGKPCGECDEECEKDATNAAEVTVTVTELPETNEIQRN